jgi:hypothetical protein
MSGAWYYDDGLDEHYMDVESFELHYADEIEGRAEYPIPADGPETLALRNASGQLALDLGAAYR